MTHLAGKGKTMTTAQKDARDRDRNTQILSERWNESYSETKRSLVGISDRDVRIMADRALFGERVY